MAYRIFVYFLLILAPFLDVQAKLPVIDAPITHQKIDEIMREHASNKVMTPELLKRTLYNYMQVLDPTKTYFIKGDVNEWLEPTDASINKMLEEFNQGQYAAFRQIHEKMIMAIARRHTLDEKLANVELPKNVSAKEFKDMEWVATVDEL
jgi:carboxyl-terminal processing protease